MKVPDIALLSSILGENFPRALERQSALGLHWLDLKDGLWGTTVEYLDAPTAQRVAGLMRDFGMEAYCFSTSIGHTVPDDQASFRARHDGSLHQALRAAEIVRPKTIRLLAPVARFADCRWVIGLYREWVDRIVAAGFQVLIENETRGCLLGSVEDIVAFFTALDRPAARYTWDVQNLWQSGTFPTLEVYRRLRPWMGALHLKGGRSDDGKTLRWAAPLEEASWPVRDIVRAAVDDGAAPFVCLNPSHGEKPPGWDIYETAVRDLAWLRAQLSQP